MGVTGTVQLTQIVEREGAQFAAHCPELGIASCGDTIEEAFANIHEAILLHLDVLEELGDRDRIFRERGIEISYEAAEEGQPTKFTRTVRVPAG